MPFSLTERILAAAFAVFLVYRTWSGMRVGIVYGDGDPDVSAETHPTAYVLTVLSQLIVACILGCIAIGTDVGVRSIMFWLATL